MEKFDPFGLMEKLLPARIIHLAIRIIMCAILTGLLIRQILLYHLFIFKPLWMVETLMLSMFLVSYLTRKDPVSRARGTKEVFFPVIGALLPFLLLFSPPNLWISDNFLALQLLFYWMTAAAALTAWGLWALRHSFSITVEARELVISGPYRYIRHPVYAGEILAALSIAAWRFSLLNVLIVVLFVVIQLLRSKWEEDKLSRIFSDYQSYAAKTIWFWQR